jgi:serine/threonine protein kinase
MDTVGSPNYMAPEMLYGKYGKEVDVWSMGVIIFQMLTGEYPFDGFRNNDIAEKIRMGYFEMPTNISENAQDLLAGMIDYKNDQRLTFKECIKHPWFTRPAETPLNMASLSKLKEYKQQSRLKEAAMNQLIK